MVEEEELLMTYLLSSNQFHLRHPGGHLQQSPPRRLSMSTTSTTVMMRNSTREVLLDLILSIGSGLHILPCQVSGKPCQIFLQENANIFYSLPSERDSNKLSATNPEMRSKTDNLERLIAEVEREQKGIASDQGGSTNSLKSREIRGYIR